MTYEAPICDKAPEGFQLGRLAILESVRRAFPETPSALGMPCGAYDGRRVWFREAGDALEVIPVGSNGDWSGLIYTVPPHFVKDKA